MAFPTITVEIAFSTNPGDSPTWTDVSTYALFGEAHRGRQRELDRIEAGTCSLLLDNSDRRFDPTYTSGPYYPNVLPMRRIRIRALYGITTYDLFAGYVERWPLQWEMPSYSQVPVKGVDGFEWLAVADVGEGLTWNQELSGARVTRVLDAASWPAGDRSIEAGQWEVPAVTFDVAANVKALAHLQDVADSELGVFFIDGQGRAVFHDRHHRLKPASQYSPLATFGDGGGSELDYDEIIPDYDKDRIVNDWRVTRSGGTVQTAEDATSIAKFVRRTQQRTPLLTNDIEAKVTAEYLLGKFKDPQLRFDRLVLTPSAIAAGTLQDDLYAQALVREIGDRIQVKKRPPGGGNVITQDCYIEGIKHDFADQDWKTTWELTPVDPNTYWILGDATYGLLGQTTRLAP